MVDIHTHILPGMDDGAKNVDMSLEMLRMQVEQGVDTVVLTPHFYRDRETVEHFLERRGRAYRALTEAIEARQAPAPKLLLGAEAAWAPNMAQWDGLEELTIARGGCMLLELPFYAWDDRMLRELYRLLDRGITPIFAHLERYVKHQKGDYIREIAGMGMPDQENAGPMERFLERRDVIRLLRRREAHIMASDCHNTTTRPPNLGRGLEMVRKFLGAPAAELLNSRGGQLMHYMVR